MYGAALGGFGAIATIHHNRSDKLTLTWILLVGFFLFDCFRSCECAADCCRDSLEHAVNPPYAMLLFYFPI